MKLLKINAFLLLATILVLSGCPSPTETGGPTGEITVDVTALEVESSVNVVVGNTTQLNVVKTPVDADTTLTWTSSDESLATVDANGLVTAVAAGDVTVTVASSKDPSIKAETSVNVVGEMSSLEGFAFVNQIYNEDGGIRAGTTTEIPSLIDNKIVITNMNLADVNSTEFHGNSILYFDTPMSGDFTISARINRVNIIDDVISSGSSNRGVLVGAIAKDDDGNFEADSKYAFMMSRTRGDVRSYYYKDTGRGAGSPNISQDDSLDEYIFEVKRDADGITFSVYNSNSGELIEENSISNVGESSGEGLHTAIQHGNEMYPAFVVGGATATISNIKIYEGEELILTSAEVDGSPVAVEGVSLEGPELNATETYDYSTAYVAGMDNIQLTAAVTPSQADDTSVIWSSSDEAVATVDASGVVTFTGAGDAIITATTNDAGFTATYSIHLTADAVPVSTITIDGVTELMEGLTSQLTATITPDDATNQSVTWSSSDNAAATVDPDTGIVTAISATEGVVITATANDGSGVTQTHTIDITAPIVTIFSWAAPTLFDATAGPVTVDGKTVTYRSTTNPPVTETGIALANGRFNIGTAYNDNGSGGATELDTSATVNVPDGEFNFAQAATVTITYAASSGTGIFVYVNNNTSSSGNSVLGTGSKLSANETLSADGGTATFTIDPAAFGNHESLATAFIQLRADSSSSIDITSIMVAYN